jgi:hypothetical protein
MEPKIYTTTIQHTTTDYGTTVYKPQHISLVTDTSPIPIPACYLHATNTTTTAFSVGSTPPVVVLINVPYTIPLSNQFDSLHIYIPNYKESTNDYKPTTKTKIQDLHQIISEGSYLEVGHHVTIK